MPDLSHRDIHDNAPVAVASERQIWDSISPEERAQILGQSIAGESNISNKESVYQKDSEKIRSYESMNYSSLPAYVQYDVSQILHDMGYFKESYGATVYEVEGENRYECKDCEETFVSEEDLRVHRKVNHDDNGESETESQEAYNYSLNIDPSLTHENLNWARSVIRGESSRVSYPQNDPKGSVKDPPLPKGRREYDDNPNHYFYDNKLFRRGTRGNYYGQDGVALTEARSLINLEDKILRKFGWESTKDAEKNQASREVFANEVAKVVITEKLHPRTIKILDSINKPFLVNTLQSLGAKWAREQEEPERGDIAPFKKDERVIHQDYDPEHPHEHNDFDQNFGNKVAEEEIEPEEWNQAGVPERKELLDTHNDFVPEEKLDEPYDELHPKTTASFDKPAEEQGYDDEEEIITSGGGEDSAIREIEDNYQRAHSQMKAQKDDPFQEYGYQKGQEEEKSELEKIIDSAPILNDNDEKIEEDHVPIQDIILQESDGRTCPTCGYHNADEQEMHSHIQDHVNEPEAQEDFPFEEQEEQTTINAEPDLLQNVDISPVEIEGEQYDPEEKYNQKAEEALNIFNYTGAKRKGGESIQNILEGAIDVPVERESINETIYNRKLEGYHEDKIARELGVYHEVEYEDAIERIRSIEVNGSDITAKTLFGKKFNDCNEAEKSEMKILGGESKKNTTGVKYD